MGSNMAEQHPVGFQWVIEAKERGAKVIHVDPRFTRTSAMADRYVPIRPGTDIAFLGGIVNYIFEHDAWFKEYVQNYTNGPVIIPAYVVGPQRARLEREHRPGASRHSSRVTVSDPAIGSPATLAPASSPAP
jgi:anaerobic selenocysteine-containing dehydrogenase